MPMYLKKTPGSKPVKSGMGFMGMMKEKVMQASSMMGKAMSTKGDNKPVMGKGKYYNKKGM